MESLYKLTLYTLLIIIVSAHIRLDVRQETSERNIQPEPDSFLRSSVETNLKESDAAFNSKSYLSDDNRSFLRTAVEKIPINTNAIAKLKASHFTQTFIRDSVESLPYEEVDEPLSTNDDTVLTKQFTDVVEQSSRYAIPIPISSVKKQYTAASIAPIPSDYHPQPYRTDLSYQELVVDPNAPTTLDEHFRTKTNEELKYYGASAHWNVNRINNGEVLCYMANWAFYRKDDGQFAPEYLDTQLCTKIIYSFASLDPDHLTIKEFDQWVDIENGYYERTTRTGIPTLIALGGWTDSAGDKYSRLADNDIKRNVFASNLVGFIQRHNFSGLHLDWNYPKCWQSDCSKGSSKDKPNLTLLLRDIRTAFNRSNRKLYLGLAVSGYKEIITEAYEFPEISKIVDYMTVMTYDYHGHWERQTGHVSPLYSEASDKHPQYSTDYTMKLVTKLGAQRDKIIMGIPFYGQSFTLAQPSTNLVGEGTLTIGPGEPGEFTKQPGMLSYYEICNRLRNQGWLLGQDPKGKSGPHAMRRTQWTGFEDPRSIEQKVQYAINSGFAGVAAWTIDLDDFQNSCCMESFPLLKAINRVLGRISEPSPTHANCARPVRPTTPLPPVMTTSSSDGSISGEHNHVIPTSTAAPSTTTTTPKTTASSWWTQSTTKRTTPRPSTTTRSTTTTTTSTTTKTTTRRPQIQTSSIPPIQDEPNKYSPTINPNECRSGEFYADKYSCNSYYQCITPGSLYQQFCSNGLHWNDNGKNCDWPDAAKCKQRPLETRPTLSTTITTTTKRPTTTPQYIHWTSSTTSTNRPWYDESAPLIISTTTSRPQINRPTTINRPLKPNSPSNSKCTIGEYYSHHQCNQYYICVNEVLVPNSCGPNLHWDAIRQICDWPENVRCVTTKAYLKQIKFRANADDPCNGEERVRDPTNCSRFLFCLWNRLQGGDCPPGLHFNTNIGACDWPTNANCMEDESAFEMNQIGTEFNNSSSSSSSHQNDHNWQTQKPSVISTTIRPTHRPTDRPTYRPTERPIASKPTQRPTNRPIPSRPTNDPIISNDYYKVVCYFTNWAWYRKGTARYTPDNIDTNLCTHVVYGFAVLDYSNLIIRTHDSWADIDNNFYTRVTGLREKGIKVSLALGGWNDSEGDKYSRLVKSSAARAKFITHSIEFLTKYGFDGLDLDWEYPVCWQTDCKKGSPDEKEAFTALVRELFYAYQPYGLLLSTAVSPNKKIIDAGYDVEELSNYFDWIAVMTYDFHGQWDKKTGHVAPLFYHPEDDVDYFNANYSLNYWIEKGAPRRKIVMGMPLYGQSFTLENVEHNGLNAKATRPGHAGKFTRAPGFLAYYEICNAIKNEGWTVVQDELGRMGPYAYKSNQWVSFDDQAMIRQKSQMVRGMDLGGAMVWALDLDDFANVCGDGPYALLQEINNVLKDPPHDYEPIPNIVTPLGGSTTESNKEEYSQDLIIGSDNNHIDIGHNDELIEIISPNSGHQMITSIPNEWFAVPKSPDEGFKVVCYFTAWSWYRQNGGKFLPEDIDPDLCTHIIYGFAILDRETLTIRPHDTWADLDNNFYQRIIAWRKKNIRVSIAIGGWNDSAGDKYSRLVRSSAAIARFVRDVISFIEKYGFDGLDLDWEYPVCWQVDCKKGSPSEKQGFTDLVREISKAFKPKGLLLSTAVSPNKMVIDAGYEVSQLSYYFDWIAVMTYDYHGQWDKKTGHVAPMYNHPKGTDTFNANFSISYWLDQGLDRHKLIMGMPLYGQSFSLAQAKDNGLNALTYGGGEAGQSTRSRGFLAYYEICTHIKKNGWTVVRDNRGRMGPYSYLRDQWVSFDDTHMIRHKSEYVRAMGLGGAMIWALDLDDFANVCECESYPLLKTINRVLRNYAERAVECTLEEKHNTRVSDDNGLPEANAAFSIPYTTNEPVSNVIADDNDPVLYDETCETSTFMAHPNDCNKYYICLHGQPSIQSCPEGLHWNKYYCDWPMNSMCITRENIRIDPIISTTTTAPRMTSEIVNKKPEYHVEKPSHSLPIHVDDGNGANKKVICYFTAWSWYRRDEGKFEPEDIDENLCTHIIYAFAVLNSNTLTIAAHDSWADLDNRFYERIVALKSKNLTVSVAIGGWNDSFGSKYSRLVLDQNARRRFTMSVVEFIEKYGFDGLDLDWEYPVCWQVDCSKGDPNEKYGFTALVRELHEVFQKRGYILSAAVSPSKKVIDAGYDIPELAKYFDWIGVMAYDYHGYWDRQTGHVAPLYYIEGDPTPLFNANFSINYWLNSGVPSEKLIMGLPLYGQTFTLAESQRTNINENAIGPGEAGPYTRAAGFMAYYEICEKVNTLGWKVQRDENGRIGPYAFNGNQWVSYDDVEDVRRKAKYIRNMNLGGGMIWALDLDDFRGRCGCDRYPLLTTINQELRNIAGAKQNNCT